MTSLSEAYVDRGGPSLGRLYLGVGLFIGGVVLLLAAIITAGTNLVTAQGYSLGDIRLWGGVLGGVGVAVAMFGVLTVLPSSRTTRAMAVVGSSVMLLGTALFYYAYPCRWIGATCGAGLTDMTLPTAGIYFVGAATTLWALFVGVANFKTRNDPGGTVKMEVTHMGETQVVELDRSELEGVGSVGFFGATPSGSVSTQTNSSNPTSDGGTSTQRVRSPLDETEDAEIIGSEGGSNQRRQPGSTQASTSPEPRSHSAGTPDSDRTNTPSTRQPTAETRSPDDRYCGSCQHFAYVRSEGGMKPYCGFHGERMDSMDACEEWSPN